MLTEQRDVFYYVTLMNENYAQPDLPETAHPGCCVVATCLIAIRACRDGREAPVSSAKQVTLRLGAPSSTEVVKAAEPLAAEGIGAQVLSVTSWSELARDGQACGDSGDDALDRPGVATVAAAPSSLPLTMCACAGERACPMSWSGATCTLGTDGFGRSSDTRARCVAFPGGCGAYCRGPGRLWGVKGG